MARQGEVLENPVTGERIEFRKTASDTAGEALTFDYYLAPGGFGLGRIDHVHPNQEERIEVESGTLGVRIDGDEWTATSGTRFGVPPETAHTVWNPGDSELHAVVELRPALETEAFFETTYGLARDGKANRTGLPGPLHSAVLADRFADEIRIGTVPGPLQRALSAVLAPVGRLLGRRATYSKYNTHVKPEARP